jgi:RHS repeat-associated protein
MQGDQSGISQTTHRGYFNESTSGNVLAVYRQGALQEQAIYGSSRLGLYRGGRTGAVRELGTRQYEISNHLGNVLSVVTDHIHLSPDSAWATVVSTTDYYAFGSSMPGRTFQSEEYRYGFQNQEKDDEISGSTGSHLSFKYRIHDARIGRFLSIDPLFKTYPWNSPYAFSENRLIDSRELEGLERVNATEYAAQKGDCFECLDKKLGYDTGTMQGLNPGVDPTNIQIGQVLQTPFTTPYMAKGQSYMPSASNTTNVTAATHNGKFKVTVTDVVSVPFGSFGVLSISSNKNAVTGFWNTTVTTGLSGSLGISPSAGVLTVMQGDIKILQDVQATSLVDWANKSGLVSTASGQLLVNYTKFTGMNPSNSAPIWEATGFGYGGSVGYSGSRALNQYSVGDFYYRHDRYANEVVIGLSTKDSIIRATFDTTLHGRSEFLERKGLSDQDLDAIKKKYNNFKQTF